MENVRIQDDLYTFINQKKLEELVIPDDQPCTGGFNTLAVDVEKIMINEFKEMCEKQEFPNEYLKNACLLFEIAKNVEKKDSDGIKPALNNLKVIDTLEFSKYSNMYKELKLKKIPLILKLNQTAGKI